MVAARTDTAELANALRGYWPPFASLADRARNRVPIVRGDGAVVWDAAGRSYIDATASLWYANVGHGRTEIADAARDQLAQLAAYSNFGQFTTEPTEQLTTRIAGLAPLENPLVFLTSGGSDAVDSAVKIVRRYWTLRGRPEKVEMISRRRSYHGMHGFGTALAGIEANASGYGAEGTSPVFVHAASNDADDLRVNIEGLGPDRVGAVFVEPVIGAGGVIPPAPGYLAAVRELCDAYDVLFVADEVVTGFGRLGSWFASEHYEVTPDLILFAKGVTSGYLPLGGIVAGQRVWEIFHDSETPFRHGYTYSGHAAACAAGLANLDIIERERLLDRVRTLQPILAELLDGLTDHPLVREVRHAGLLGAVELTVDGPTINRVVASLRDNGVLTRILDGGALHLSPPFVISEEQLRAITDGIRTTLDSIA